MGCLASAEVKEERRRHREEGKRNEDIERQILFDKMAMNLAAMKNEVTMLLIGAINTFNNRHHRVWENYTSRPIDIARMDIARTFHP